MKPVLRTRTPGSTDKLDVVQACWGGEDVTHNIGRVKVEVSAVSRSQRVKVSAANFTYRGDAPPKRSAGHGACWRAGLRSSRGSAPAVLNGGVWWIARCATD